VRFGESETVVKGQRVWRRARGAVVLDSAHGLAIIELDSGAVELVAERELQAAENAESVKQREGRT
jgi:hypothetical protein